MSSQYITSSTARRVAGTGLVIEAVGIPAFRGRAGGMHPTARPSDRQR